MEVRLSDLEARHRSLEPPLAVVSQPPLASAKPRSLASTSSPSTCPVQPEGQGGWVTVLRLKTHQLMFPIDSLHSATQTLRSKLWFKPDPEAPPKRCTNP
ncbi:unnamed protein product [Pleuronectes platessa]|uniref:Uncharacterized protein n=1 Tax=Pleuronectes platessa TaxID=8262 RepID=A0A9N7UB07_PLEPL|nr:unnamed protein product [Pleuronectes platessa]